MSMAKKKTASLKSTLINPDHFHKSQIKFYCVLLPIAVIMLLPIVYMFFHAFKPMDELFAYPPRFITLRPTLSNFQRLLMTTGTTRTPASIYLFNSIAVSAIVLVLTLIIGVAAAYTLSKRQFHGKNAIFKINQLSLMFVATAVSIPRYLVVANLGLLNTFWAQILPLLAMPVGLFLLKQNIDQLPDAVIEAARIDGATEYGILFRIIVPMVKPALATVAMLVFQNVWTNTEASTNYITRESLKTFAFYMNSLTSITGNSVAGQGMAAASSLIMFVPVLVLFIFMQSRVMNTMSHSGIK